VEAGLDQTRECGDFYVVGKIGVFLRTMMGRDDLTEAYWTCIVLRFEDLEEPHIPDTVLHAHTGLVMALSISNLLLMLNLERRSGRSK